ncbi:MAG: NAD(P)H-hydrate dehydratase [Desulfobulbus sp.]|jgi:NAD(P)H-hydrate epimerase|uniref:NAD(P)H-hydrate dehydratase n=1 Tax=Desulfobulbus sp. TaxID=895 RepID=UPI00284250C8|nr:NAD(P)H-hydrate dehydratase [Desulfobulbus sp.]MDR2550916.1 NAD(P)H-hydrate dehydratase [Desulfobulbus sp.]
MQLALAAQMRELDRQTIEEIGIPGMVLMENAGRSTVDRMEQVLGPVAGKTVCVFAGPGNNGGDGLVIARTVHGLGGFPFVFFPADPERLAGDAGLNFEIYRRLRLPYQVLDNQEKFFALADTVLTLNRMHPIHSLVDALFGTGLEREIGGGLLETITCMNTLRHSHRLPVVSVDIPSGLHSDTGAILGGAVQADLTVTYGLAKPGHYHHGGTRCGRLACIDIGIPAKLVARMQLQGTLIDRTMLAGHLGLRPATAHKGSNGHLLVLAGSSGKTGAALLCGQGALRSGAGLVTFAVPGDLNPIFETAVAETMSVPLPASNGFLSIDDYPQIEVLCAGKNGIVLGPGIGTEPETRELVLRLYGTYDGPMVIDADALSILAAHPDLLRNPPGPRIFTPHPGEMARLLGTSVETVQADRLKAAQWLNASGADRRPPMITVLKGPGTVVATTGGAWAINASGNPGMATGGMGDVLAGIIGGLLAQGHDPWQAACFGVHLHGLAADRLAAGRPYGYTATEVARQLPRAIGSLCS